jgi:hypothetical protein
MGPAVLREERIQQQSDTARQECPEDAQQPLVDRFAGSGQAAQGNSRTGPGRPFPTQSDSET